MYIPIIVIPILISLYCLYRFIKDGSDTSSSHPFPNFGALFSIFWLIPSMFVWIVYLCYCLLIK
jgi:hypothetical protein